MSSWTRRQVGRRDPHRIIPVRRASAYAGGAPATVAANDNPAPLSRRLQRAWILPFGLITAVVLALTLA